MSSKYSGILAATNHKPVSAPSNRLGAALSGLLKLGSRLSAKRKNTMELCETLSLGGDKRFLAVVVVEQQKFLVGGGGNSVALLAELPSRKQSRATTDNEVHLL
jgi:flagellar biogenesis protein FliO